MCHMLLAWGIFFSLIFTQLKIKLIKKPKNLLKKSKHDGKEIDWKTFLVICLGSTFSLSFLSESDFEPTGIERDM